MAQLTYRQKKYLIFGILLIVLLAGAFMRFFNADWGSGFFFHPDERLVGTAVTNLDFAKRDFDPNFLNYGSLPIYSIYLISGPNFERALITGRLLAALASTLTVLLLFPLTLEFLDFIALKKQQRPVSHYILALTASILAAFSFGMIQGAHFTTPEIYLVLEYALTLYISLKLVRSGHLSWYLLLSLILAAAWATKIVSIVLLPILIIAHFSRLIFISPSASPKVKSGNFAAIKFFLKNYVIKDFNKLVIAGLFFILTAVFFSPYYFLDWQNFLNMFSYESNLAKGVFTVFYTQQFTGTVPGLYQLTRVLPYILNWPLTIAWILGIIYLVFKTFRGIRKKEKSVLAIFILLAIQLLYGGENLLQFVKWTRYMLPLLPFAIVTVVLLFYYLLQVKIRKLQMAVSICITGIIIWTVLQGGDYFSIYLQPDPRIAAAAWSKANIPAKDLVITEPSDIGLQPWNNINFTFPNIYYLESDKTEEANLAKALSKAKYVIIPSNRIYESRFRIPDTFPKGNAYYRNLFSGELGFSAVKEFKRLRLSELLWGSPDINRWKNYSFNYLMPDETFDVYDNPTVLIFARKP